METTSLVKEMRAVIEPINFYNIGAANCFGKIRTSTKYYLLTHIDVTINTNDVIAVQVSNSFLPEVIVFTVKGMHFRAGIGRPRFLPYWSGDLVQKNKRTLIFKFSDGPRDVSLKISSSRMDVKKLMDVFLKCKHIHNKWSQTVIWDNERPATYTYGVPLLYSVGYLDDSQPCSARTCVRLLKTEEEEEEEIKKYLEKHPEEFSSGISEVLERFYCN